MLYIKFKQKLKPVLIIVLMIIGIIVSFSIFNSFKLNISTYDLVKNQQLVFDASFNNETDIKNIAAPKVNYNNFFLQGGIDYNIKGLNTKEKNMAYFIYPLNNLDALQKYKVKIAFNFASPSKNMQKILIGDSSDIISQGVSLTEANRINSNINVADDIKKEFYVEKGNKKYQAELNITSNKEGMNYLIIGLDVGKNDNINFNIGNLDIILTKENDA